MLQSIIDRLDQPVPQILVEARIMELNIDSDLEKEVDLFYQDIGVNPLTGDMEVLKKVGSQLGVPGAAPSDSGGIVNASIWENGSELSFCGLKCTTFLRFKVYHPDELFLSI